MRVGEADLPQLLHVDRRGVYLLGRACCRVEHVQVARSRRGAACTSFGAASWNIKVFILKCRKYVYIFLGN